MSRTSAWMVHGHCSSRCALWLSDAAQESRSSRRSFLPEEDKHGGEPVVMISSELWRRRFNCDPQVVGKPATIDAVPYTIIGVLPAGFAFPVADVDMWVTRPSEWSALPSRAWRTV